MLRNISLSIFLFLCGILGSLFPIFLNRDGATIIIIGFGFGALQIYNKIQDNQIDVKNFKIIRIIVLIEALIAIAGMSFNVYRYKTNFNKVLVVGFIIIQLWICYSIFMEMNTKIKK